jgi:O-antigen ligase
MPLLNRFDRPPRAWPAPASPECVADAVDYPRRRDPVGDGIHTALAGLAAFGVSISTAVASITMTLLIGYTLLRLPNAWWGWTPLVRSAPVAAWLAWFAWAAVSGLWTPVLLDWGDSLGGFPALLLFPSFYLVSRSWRWILGAFVAGAACQGLAQAVHACVPAWRPEWQPRFDGLATHPGHVATVSAMALLVALAWLRDAAGWRSRIWPGVAACGCLLSVGLAAGRGALVGLAVGAVVLGLSMAIRFGLGRGGRVLAFGIPVLTAIVLGIAAAGHGPESLVHAVRDSRSTAADSSMAQRFLWWQASWDAFRDHPIGGIGTGGTATWFDNSPRIDEYAAGVPERDRAFFSAPHPHSMYSLTLAEQGAVGILLLCTVLATTLAAAIRNTAVRPLGCGLLAALVAWWVAGAFESVNLPMRLMAPLVLVTTFACLPRGPGTGLTGSDAANRAARPATGRLVP